MMIWEMKWKDSKPGGLYDKFIELEGSNKNAQNWNFWAFTINQRALDSVLLLVPGTGDLRNANMFELRVMTF